MKNNIILSFMLGLVGCVGTPLKHHTKNSVETLTLEKKLVEAANSIERSLGTLAMLQEHKAPPLLNTEPLITPEGGMGVCADIDWTGPIEPLIRKLAELTNYRVKILGNEPAIPIVVSISQEKAIVADILKNAGLQAGKRANLLVFPANRIIEIRYEAIG